jgi:hypothetical protein
MEEGCCLRHLLLFLYVHAAFSFFLSLLLFVTSNIEEKNLRGVVV